MVGDHAIERGPDCTAAFAIAVDTHAANTSPFAREGLITSNYLMRRNSLRGHRL